MVLITMMIYASVLSASTKHAPQQLSFSSQSAVTFEVTILGVFTKTGSFTDIDGALVIEGARAVVSARIRTASATMKKSSDAELLKSPAYFDAAHYPEILFRSQPFSLSLLKSGGSIVGQVHLRGVTQSLAFQLVPEPCQRQRIELCPLTSACARNAALLATKCG
jgi:polyisoprenoid-binding protein YceI